MMSTEEFVERFQRCRAKLGPLVFGLDPSSDLLRDWGLEDSPLGLEAFIDISLKAASGVVGIIKPQSAFFERHGWRGIKALTRLIAEARAENLLVILDAKRGDIGSTNHAYAQAYLTEDAPLFVDALTVSPYMGLQAMRTIFDSAQESGSAIFVVVRSSNPEGRALQTALQPQGHSVEEQLMLDISKENQRIAPDRLGPIGAVFAPNHSYEHTFDMRSLNGLFLSPGLGAQGASANEIPAIYAGCLDRVLPSASRSLLSAGPDISKLQAGIHDLASSLKVELKG